MLNRGRRRNRQSSAGSSSSQTSKSSTVSGIKSYSRRLRRSERDTHPTSSSSPSNTEEEDDSEGDDDELTSVSSHGCHCKHVDDLTDRVDAVERLVEETRQRIPDGTDRLPSFGYGNLETPRPRLNYEPHPNNPSVNRSGRVTEDMMPNIDDELGIQEEHGDFATNLPTPNIAHDELDDPDKAEWTRQRTSFDTLKGLLDKNRKDDKRRGGGTSDLSRFLQQLVDMYEQVNQIVRIFRPKCGVGETVHVNLDIKEKGIVEDDIKRAWAPPLTIENLIKMKILTLAQCQEGIQAFTARNFAAIECVVPSSKDTKSQQAKYFIKNQKKRIEFFGVQGFGDTAWEQLKSKVDSAEARAALRIADDVLGPALHKYFVFESEYRLQCQMGYHRLITETQAKRAIGLGNISSKTKAQAFDWAEKQRALQDELLSYGYSNVNPLLLSGVGRAIWNAAFTTEYFKYLLTQLKLRDNWPKVDYHDFTLDHLILLLHRTGHKELVFGEGMFYGQKDKKTTTPRHQKYAREEGDPKDNKPGKGKGKGKGT